MVVGLIVTGPVVAEEIVVAPVQFEAAAVRVVGVGSHPEAVPRQMHSSGFVVSKQEAREKTNVAEVHHVVVRQAEAPTGGTKQ